MFNPIGLDTLLSKLTIVNSWWKKLSMQIEEDAPKREKKTGKKIKQHEKYPIQTRTLKNDDFVF